MMNVSNANLILFLGGVADWLDCLSTDAYCDYVDTLNDAEHELWSLLTSEYEP